MSKPFIERHIGTNNADIAHMLSYLGASSLDDFIKRIVPTDIQLSKPLALPAPLSEAAAAAHIADLAGKNQTHIKSLIGLGYYGTHTPAVLRRNILENPAWYTAYTPYQPEISQGRLEALLIFQQMVTDLTGLDIACASLLDEATAAAEAMMLCHRHHAHKQRAVFLVHSEVYAHTIDVLQARAAPLQWQVQVIDTLPQNLDNVFGALVQSPASDGLVTQYAAWAQAMHQQGALLACATDLLAATIEEPVATWGVDIAFGSTQRFGMPMGYGGPHAAFFACKDAQKRLIPGRLAGVSVDSQGNTAYRLTLQTREQHIRRDKAMSNICTAQVLPAVMAAMYAVYHGAEGLQRIALRIKALTHYAHAALTQAGFAIKHISLNSPLTEGWQAQPDGVLPELVVDKHPSKGGEFAAVSERGFGVAVFDTITINTAQRTDALMHNALQAGFNLNRVDDHTISFALDETCTADTVYTLLKAFGVNTQTPPTNSPLSEGWQAQPDGVLPELVVDKHPAPSEHPSKRGEFYPVTLSLCPALPHAQSNRTTPFLTHKVFTQYHSETAMMRYLRRLVDRDLALDRTMIPLGSCTMKLNAAVEMESISLPSLANVHPFAPWTQAEGTLQMIASLEDMLCEVTGFDAVSLQPNSGAMGEYAGLQAIAAWHRAQGHSQRTVCLIPTSAHGTNPASAVMAGMQVVPVRCDEQGNIDVTDLTAKAAQHAEALAALMVTYPSTHGVFETAIRTICAIVHQHGGLVYMDGANMNAQTGLTSPAAIGADVCHLNLHKTFCIPHGGGGPGVGPIGVKDFLAPFLPGHRALHNAPARHRRTFAPVAAAPFGSALILAIPYLYIRLMGEEGLTKAAQIAILHANYIAARLKQAYPILYTDAAGWVAHECILDLRAIKTQTGVSVEDVAKRLIDYGFHAPTMSWPVAGTLMIEPTESEPRAEIDRFCEAMLAIKREIDEIAAQKVPLADSPLTRAPHTLAMICEGTLPYSAMHAAYPAGRASDKYFPPVGRVDNVHGDRNLFCACPDDLLS